MGVITHSEANIKLNSQRADAVFSRCLCLELGQALAVMAREYSAAGDIFRVAADLFAGGSSCDPTLPSAGLFLREVYSHWGRAMERRERGGAARGTASDASASAAARDVYELAVSRGVWAHPLQRPQDRYLRALRARPFWDAAELPAARALETHAAAILAEARGLMASQFRSYRQRGPDHGGADDHLVTSGSWSDVHLFFGCRKDFANCARCPRTAAAIASEPRLNECFLGTCWFSRLAPGTHLASHCGPSNFKLRCHLGVQVPRGARIRVGSEEREWKQGECLVFDESFEHEVWHEGAEDRIVLIADMWHPDLDVERAVPCGAEQRAALEAARAGRHLPRRA